MNKIKRLAFTLSEVLIVLSIIGMIAQMTIPTLLGSTQKQTIITQLQKEYANINEAFTMLEADEGVSDIGQSSLFDGSAFSGAARQNVVDSIIKKKFRTNKTCLYGDTSCQYTGSDGGGGTITVCSSGAYNFYLADGSTIQMSLNDTCLSDDAKTGKIKGICGNVWIDVNGEKAPNVRGKDIYLYWLASNGIWYPGGGKDTATFQCGDGWQTCTDSNKGYWSATPTASNWAQCGVPGTKNQKGGGGCAGRIMEEGWQITYF